MIVARNLCLALGLTLTFAASASHLSVSVAKTVVESSTGPGLLYVTFADEPPVIDVVLSVYSIAGRPSSTKGLSELRRIDDADWWTHAVWKLINTQSNAARIVAPGTLQVVRATTEPVAMNGALQHRGTFQLEKLPFGDYEIEVVLAGVRGSDTFAVRSGTETIPIRDKYLERKALRTTDYGEFRRIQLERLDHLPQRADILLDLARRSLESGTLSETGAYYERAAQLMADNAAVYSKTVSPARAKELKMRLERAVGNIAALQAELPSYFAHRSELRIAEERVNGELRFVLKERRSGRALRVIE